LVKIATYKNAKSTNNGFSDGNGFYFCLVLIVPLIIALKLKDINAYSRFIEGKDSSPLIDISKKIKPTFFTAFITYVDKYETNDKMNTEIELTKNLKDVYKAIFNSTESAPPQVIGKCEFNHSTLSFIRETENLLSTFADFDI